MTLVIGAVTSYSPLATNQFFMRGQLYQSDILLPGDQLECCPCHYAEKVLLSPTQAATAHPMKQPLFIAISQKIEL